MKLGTAAAMLLATLLGVSTSTHAQEHGPRQRPPMGPGQMEHRPPPPLSEPLERLQELGVTEVQVEELSELEYALQKEGVALRATVETAELELRHLMASTDTTEETLSVAIDELNAARAAQFKHHTLGRFRVETLLGKEVLRALHPKRPPHEKEMQDDDA